MEIKIEPVRLDKGFVDLENYHAVSNEQIKLGQVLVNGQPRKPNTVQEGDIVTYHVTEPEVLEYVAGRILPEIVIKMRMWLSLISLRDGCASECWSYQWDIVNALMYHIKDLSGIKGACVQELFTVLIRIRQASLGC